MISPALQAHLDSAGTVLDNLPHSSLWVALIATVIAAFRSGIVWGLLPYTLSLKVSPQIKIWGFKSGECGDHCGSHLRQINRSRKHCCSHANDSFEVWGWHHPVGTTGGSWRPFCVDQVLARTCQAPGHIARCWLSLTAHCHPQTRMVQWCHVWRWQPRQCTCQSVMAFADSAQGVWGSELVDPSVDHWVDRKFTTSEPFFELQLSCVDRFLPKICLNYKYLLLSSPWHLEGQIW